MTRPTLAWTLVPLDADQALHDAVARMDDWISLEIGLKPFGWRPEKTRDAEAWLLGSVPLGGVIFTKPGMQGARWHLDRLWIDPAHRRRGVVDEILPAWQVRYRSISTHPRPVLRTALKRRGWVESSRDPDFLMFLPAAGKNMIYRAPSLQRTLERFHAA